MGRQRSWVRVVQVLLVAFLAVLAGAGGLIAYWWHDLVTPPDVAAAARSPEVDRAARLAVEPVDSPVRAAMAAAPWAEPVAVGVEDVCRTEAGPFFGSGYQPVVCTRTTTAILAGSGRVADRRTGWPADVRVDWVESPEDLAVWLAKQPPKDSELEVHRSRTQFDAEAVRAAQARSGFLVVVSASLPYYDGSVRPTPPPEPEYGCRDTDSARCPGG